mmetsp:Transcript_37569/g.107329  ORF Transcript_37569/g.107329 Transcript_37569/m.107329 type:complete len:240 (+) Transcript_37569:640-1359(+)
MCNVFMSAQSKFPYSCSRIRTSSRTVILSPGQAWRMPLSVSLVRMYGETVNLTVSVPTMLLRRFPASSACSRPSAVRCSMWSGTVTVIERLTLPSDSPCRTKMSRRGRPRDWDVQKLLLLRRCALAIRLSSGPLKNFPSAESIQSAMALGLCCGGPLSLGSAPPSVSDAEESSSPPALFACPPPDANPAAMDWSLRDCTTVMPADSVRSLSRRCATSAADTTPSSRSFGAKSERPVAVS